PSTRAIPEPMIVARSVSCLVLASSSATHGTVMQERPIARAALSFGRRVPSGTQREGARMELIDRGVAAQGERQVELGEQAAQHVLHARLAVEREAPHVWPPEADGVGAQSKRLEDVRAGADAAVEQDRELLAHHLPD